MAKNFDENQSYLHRLVWLDENIDDPNHQEQVKQLREFDEKIKTFSRKQTCIDYIQQQNDDRNTKSSIIFIVSQLFSEEVIPQISDCSCILGVFIFGTKPKQSEHLKSLRMISMCTNIAELIVRIRTYLHRDRASIDFSFLNNQNAHETSENSKSTNEKESSEHSPIRNLQEDQARFLWFYKCHNFMIELQDDDQQAKEEMIRLCQENYTLNKLMKTRLRHFEDESLEENARNAIFWYAQSSIIFRCINEAFVSGNIETIYTYRYMIKLLCRQLKELHREYKEKTKKDKNKLELYRGLQLKLSDILRISKHRNDLISLNGFISTSLEKDVAKMFCSKRERKPDHEPVIIKIDIDLTTEQSIAFADISHMSPYPEEEILLSIGAVFRIESVEFNEENQLYFIHLSLSSHEKFIVNNYIEQTFAKEVDANDLSVLFGKLLFDMSEYEFAIKYFQNRIECLSDVDNHHRATYLNNIGVCYNAIGEKDQALKFYKTASRFYAHWNNHRGLGACYHNIASYYYDEKDYENAGLWALKALQEREDYALEKATTLDLLAFIQLAKRNAEAACDNLRESLEIRLKYLSSINSNHPDIGISYENLGRLDLRTSSYIDAQNNFLRAEEIFRQNYPESHPLVKEIAQYLKEVQRKLEH